ncbi:allantoinase PuuE [Vineibacter terrae]|uniref:allantoinase PuuE n=1 Tax=Vineibacter terrae TaxID=2586908 RepID=UPI002E2EF83B|nr:allantoinase PuuE [Vineibacter terrae]HEX2885449.1 allantoinase PuuE [Vineibacter terrae]
MAHERDLVGYGGRPPDPKWPNRARLAVNFVLNYEEGSEYSVANGDAFSETTLTDAGAGRTIKGRDLGAESLFEYGSRSGFWRVHRIMRERQAPMTVYGCAMALEQNPAAAAAIRDSGWDLAGHGWRWMNHFDMEEAQERDLIRQSIASFQSTVGQRPYGWYCRYAPSTNTRRLLVEEGGFLYDSDSYADDLPYWTTVAGKAHLVIPYTMSTNDQMFYRGNFGKAEDWFQFIRDAVDVLYREGRTQPKMLSIGLHARIIGHPARASALERLLDYLGGFSDIWITRRKDIAEHWIATHPAPDRR